MAAPLVIWISPPPRAPIASFNKRRPPGPAALPGESVSMILLLSLFSSLFSWVWAACEEPGERNVTETKTIFPFFSL